MMARELPEYEVYQAAEDAIVDKPANSFTGIAVKLALFRPPAALWAGP